MTQKVIAFTGLEALEAIIGNQIQFSYSRLMKETKAKSGAKLDSEMLEVLAWLR